MPQVRRRKVKAMNEMPNTGEVKVRDEMPPRRGTIRSQFRAWATQLGLRTEDPNAAGLVRSVMMADPDETKSIFGAAKRYLMQIADESLAASKFATFSRQQRRRQNFGKAMSIINEVAGGEPRRNRRSMARARAKREWVRPVAAKA